MLRDQGEPSQTRRLYEQVLAVAPQDAHALAGLAGVLRDGGDEQGAQKRFAQLLAFPTTWNLFLLKLSTAEEEDVLPG